MRTIWAVTLAAAAMLAPAVARAQGRASGPGVFAGIFGGAQVTTESSSVSSLALRLDGSYDLAVLNPKVDVAAVVSLGLFHYGDRRVVPFPGGVGVVTVDSQASVFELVPAARFDFVLADRVWLVADVGAGLGYTAAAGPANVGGLPLSVADSGLCGIARFGFGATVIPTADVRIAIELVGLNLRFGDGVGTTYDFLVGISHRL